MQKFLLAVLVALSLYPTSSIAKTETAVFAGGCFWCVESDFDKVKGVISTTSGYAGGTMKNPTYRNHEGNQEVVKVEFDPSIISLKQLIADFLRRTDVTDDGGQFCDRGDSYISALYYTNDDEKKIEDAEIKNAKAKLGQKIVTAVKSLNTFTAAENYHQNYYLGENRVFTRFGWVKQSYAYEQYRLGCGRDAQVKKVWGAMAFTSGPAEVLAYLGPVANPFHPNLRSPFVCFEVRPATSLTDLIFSLFELVTWSLVSTHDEGLNHEASQWHRNHKDSRRFPIDCRPLKRRALNFTVTPLDPKS